MTLRSLLELGRLLSAASWSQGQVELAKVESEFLEAVTFASADEIVRMLETVLDEDYAGLPIWARNLAYRLACLQRPEDSALLREASADLFNHGPDWDRIAEELRKQADAAEE
ncbi:hypothetical protein ACLQ28_18480 [Micromonospora sp. DT201]|uniref:hypothetical protein n=1 Tax=Micromonospora sp. DT201 TaxID=3393442 RepID=UPI003CF86F75